MGSIWQLIWWFWMSFAACGWGMTIWVIRFIPRARPAGGNVVMCAWPKPSWSPSLITRRKTTNLSTLWYTWTSWVASLTRSESPCKAWVTHWWVMIDTFHASKRLQIVSGARATFFVRSGKIGSTWMGPTRILSAADIQESRWRTLCPNSSKTSWRRSWSSCKSWTPLQMCMEVSVLHFAKGYFYLMLFAAMMVFISSMFLLLFCWFCFLRKDSFLFTVLLPNGWGCQYWALGDEQLMADHPKDTDYRKKVMRWGHLGCTWVGEHKTCPIRCGLYIEVYK